MVKNLEIQTTVKKKPWNTGWLNCGFTNDFSIMQTLHDVRNLQVRIMYILMNFLSVIVSRAILFILVLN